MEEPEHDTTSDRFGGDDWIPERALKAVEMDKQVNSVADPKTGEAVEPTSLAMMRKLFRDNGPAAAMRICHIAIHGTNDRTALVAAQYVVERGMGRLQDAAQVIDDPLTKLFEEMQAKEDSNTRDTYST